MPHSAELDNSGQLTRTRDLVVVQLHAGWAGACVTALVVQETIVAAGCDEARVRVT